MLLELAHDKAIRPREIETSEAAAPEENPVSDFHYPQLAGQREARRRMLVIGGVTSLVFLGLAMFIFLEGNSEQDAPSETNPSPPGEAAVAATDPAGTSEQSLTQRLRDAQFSAQGNAVQHFLADRGVFPAAWHDPKLPPDQSLSWIASLEAQADPDRLPPLWNHAWNDPLNDHFIRRSLPHFLNPAIAQKASPDRYPATHFVGIAGLGRDASRLPKTDPRAGMFGTNRSVTVADLTRGRSQTWMISGVQENFGAWAAGGRATVRGVIDGPLIGGPSGFGVGVPDSMPILMADGSVRELSANTDPDVFQALATLRSRDRSERIPRESPELPEIAAHAPPLVAPKPEPPSLEQLLSELQAELATEPEPEPVDVDHQLAQKLLLFEQPRELPLSTILSEFEEIAGVKIVADRENLGEYFSRLDRRLRITLTEPTLKQVLEKLLERGGLWYRVENGRIILIPSSPLSD
jgi:hypothetical protein